MTPPDAMTGPGAGRDTTRDGGRDVVVIGAGLAGITAALRCADAGHRVTLLESRPRLGGLTYSFRRGDLDVDNGQHVFLRCCTAYQQLLQRLSVADQVTLQDRLDIPVRSPWLDGTTRLRRNALPAPLHLSGALARYRLLSPNQRLRFVLAALAMRRLDRTGRAADQRSFADWLAEHKQDARTIDAMWDLVGVATLNVHPDQCSLAQAAMVFQVGLLTDAGAADIGWAKVPLQRLHGDAAQRALDATGTAVRTGTQVVRIEPTEDRWTVHVKAATGEDAEAVPPPEPGDKTSMYVADDVILAVPPGPAERLLPAGVMTAAPGWADRLGTSPIINLHVVLDRKVLDGPFVAGVGTPIQWVFDRTEQSGLHGDGQYLAVSVSAADDYIGQPVAQLRDQLMPDLQALLPEMRNAQIMDFFVTRERSATFRPAPGTGALRPGALTSAPGLFLAGAWTDTGWPATMEGAVRSGDAAAAAVMARPVRQGVAV